MRHVPKVNSFFLLQLRISVQSYRLPARSTQNLVATPLSRRSMLENELQSRLRQKAVRPGKGPSRVFRPLRQNGALHGNNLWPSGFIRGQIVVDMATG